MLQTVNKSNFLEEASADEDYQKRNLRVKPQQLSKNERDQNENENSENNNKDSSRSISHNSHNRESDEESNKFWIFLF